MSAVSFALRSTALVAALGLAGCAGGYGSSMMSKDETYTARMTAAQEVPANASAGSGMAEVTVDPSSMKASWKVSYSGLTGPVAAGHIHGPAPEGKNAGVVVPFAKESVAASPIMGQATLTAAQYADLKAGNWYVNLHTAQNPGGEIRGQLKPR